ncbi:iduronate 2-sulfatase isoform X3 [Cryptotermes secundus]|uniref:iduronate 2-sulfatase isoform X3 n=1 Tax=Cryptotermes secundus TaxID=105785 RepID=UPI000CD7AAE3|nr:iduronate 2-sulfatase isoform X3 [Cryptotermes secundus]
MLHCFDFRVMSSITEIILNTLYIFLSFSGIEAKDNIVFIIVDDLRPALGCYGDTMAHTPNIDALAESSIYFNNAYVQQALCAPSRNSFLTSRRPDTLHLYDFYSYWREVAGNFTTLPQYFKENGYHTKAIGKIFHPGISSNWSDDQPYSWSEAPYHPPTQHYKEASVCPQADGTFGRNLVCPVEVRFQPGHSLPDLQSLDEATKFLQAQSSATLSPFFLAVGFHKPHVPLKYPVKYRELHPLESIHLPSAHWRPSALPTVAWNPWTDLREREDVAALNVSFPFGPMPGWSMAEHGEWSKYSNFEVSVRVPFILHVPGLTDSIRFQRKEYLSSSALVELVDIFPTLVELTGLPVVPPLCPVNSSLVQLCTEGISIGPVVEDAVFRKVQGTEARNRHLEQKWKTGVFSQYPRPGLFPTLKPNSDKPRLKQIKVMGYSLRTSRHRYTEWVLFDRKNFKPDWKYVISRELYDHQVDPEENMNIADRSVMSETVRALSMQLRAGWRYSLPKDMLRRNYSSKYYNDGMLLQGG